MTKPQYGAKDLEVELWNVYSSLDMVDDAVEKASMQLKALDLMVKIRVAGQKVKQGDEPDHPDSSLAKARAKVNGVSR